MSIFSKVAVWQLEDGSPRFLTVVNGKEVKNVKAIDISMSADETPRAKITLNAFPEFSGDAITEFWLETESVRECIRAVRFELMVNNNFADNLAHLIASKLDGDMTKAREIVDVIAEDLEL